MAGKHKVASDLLDILVSPARKKRRLVGHGEAWDDADQSPHRRHPHPSPFNKADADALYHQMKEFEKEYREEGCIAPKMASPNDVELGMIRGTLHLRHREISNALYHTFYANPSRSLSPFSPTYRHLVDYRATLTRHQALWRHRKARRRTLGSSRAIVRKTARLVREEVAADADDERDLQDANDPSRLRVAFEKRKKWYRTVKRDMRKRGQWISKEAPGPGIEWEPVDVPESPSVMVRFFYPVSGDWVLPEHVRTGEDFELYLNQLHLRFSPVLRRPKAQILA